MGFDGICVQVLADGVPRMSFINVTQEIRRGVCLGWSFPRLGVYIVSRDLFLVEKSFRNTHLNMCRLLLWWLFENEYLISSRSRAQWIFIIILLHFKIKCAPARLECIMPLMEFARSLCEINQSELTVKHLFVGMAVTLKSLATPFLHHWRAVLSAIRRWLQNCARPMHHSGAARRVALAPWAPVADGAIGD